ncbi:MAG TPA: bifunctional 4-hydroxy-3-methylbut-2-enyl diphosphate reductase/30S ribosomal protein S1 [Clostridiales bacterium]|nr:bifunctional 4-hydroxy-3-methylbut-2-enyl diphosphate reductase/30S ribosomal protein S1 [Clostridiales bacterium]
MNITMAKSAGFCFGVKRAIHMALVATGDGPACSLGPLIHNMREVERLAEHGVSWADSIDELKGKTVIIRSHGVPPTVTAMLKDRGYRLIDATCPFVKKAQDIAAKSKEAADLVVIVGDKHHPEVQGLLGFAGEQALVVNDLAEAKQHTYPETVAVLSQTTQSREEFQNVVGYIQSQVPRVIVNNTICEATAERQTEVAKIARDADLVLVIGDKNSANTRKLAAIAAENGAKTAVIENGLEINKINFKDVQKIGVTAGASTPDWIIEEVLKEMKEDSVMEEKILNENETAETTVECAVKEEPIVTEEAAAPCTPEDIVEEEETMAASYAAYSKDIALVRRGERLSGTIIKVSESELMVDIGAKSEGVIPRNELTPNEAEHIAELFKEGDRVDVVVLRRENEDGHPLLSKKRVDVDIAWEKLAAAMKAGEILEGKVLDVVKGGLLVDVGLKGFVPASLVEMGFVSQLDKYKNEVIKFKVLECDKNHNKLILSRKAFLEEEKEEKATKAWAEIEKDQVRRGVVQRITNFGAFIDLDGVDGLLHVSQMAWYRVNHPSEILNIGDEIEVYVLNVDRENQKISLGLKQLIPDPWSMVPERYPVDAIVEAKVVRTATFGAFVQLEPGVEGLVHISQLAWGRVAKTEDAVTPGDMVKVKVLGFDLDGKKISLSIKETMDRPAPQDETAPAHAAAENTEYSPDEEVVTIGDLMESAETVEPAESPEISETDEAAEE